MSLILLEQCINFQKNINECKDTFNIHNKDNLVSVIIGGPNQHYTFSKKIVHDLINQIKN